MRTLQWKLPFDLPVKRNNQICVCNLTNKKNPPVNAQWTFQCTIQDPVKGKTWRSLDLANQSHSNSNSHNPTSTIVTTATSTNTSSTTSVHHNSLINNAPTHYQRHDFKNRRSSSEPANEQKLLPHIQNSHNTTTINQNTNSNTANNSTLVVEDAKPHCENPGDDFIECLHQKSIKVSKMQSKHFPVFYYSISSLTLSPSSKLFKQLVVSFQPHLQYLFCTFFRSWSLGEICVWLLTSKCHPPTQWLPAQITKCSDWPLLISMLHFLFFISLLWSDWTSKQFYTLNSLSFEYFSRFD